MKSSARLKISPSAERQYALRGDVRDQKIAQEAIDGAAAHYGRVDLLINDAGVIQTGPIEHMTIQDFEDAMAVHLWGPFYTTMAALPHMRRQGGGRIVNTSSMRCRSLRSMRVARQIIETCRIGTPQLIVSPQAKAIVYFSTLFPGITAEATRLMNWRYLEQPPHAAILPWCDRAMLFSCEQISYHGTRNEIDVDDIEIRPVK